MKNLQNVRRHVMEDKQDRIDSRSIEAEDHSGPVKFSSKMSRV